MAKQLNLDFGEPTNNGDATHPVKILFKPDNTVFLGRKEKLMLLTKSTLTDNAAFFIDLIRKYSFRYKKDGGDEEETPKIIKNFEKTRNLQKESWAELLTWFFDEHNIKYLLDELTPDELRLLEVITRNRYCSSEDVKKIFGKRCLSKDYWGNTILSIPDNLEKFCLKRPGQYSWGYGKMYLYFNDVLQHTLLKTFYAGTLQSAAIDKLPGEANLNTYGNEGLICTKMNVLASLYDTHVIPNIIDKMLVSQIKKAKKVLSIPEIFEESDDKKLTMLCVSGLLNYYMIYRYIIGKSVAQTPEDQIKQLVCQGFSFQPCTLSVILPHIKGLRKNRLDYATFNRACSLMLLMLKKHADKGWKSVSSILLHMRTFNYESSYQFSLINHYELEDMTLKNNYYGRGDVIGIQYLIKQFSEPYFKALLVVLATLGVVEIAYRKAKTEDTSCYDGIEYVRLTQLGKYALGLTDKYTPAIAKDSGPAFELDDARLLIRVIDKKSPFLPLINDYATQISPSLYKVSNEDFLKGCSDITELDNKVKMFNTYICEDPPQIWRQFFNTLHKRCNPFGKVSAPYAILTIKPEDKDLQNLVLTEPSVRKYVIKAEKYIILIKKSELSQFASALKKFGYIL